MTNTTSAKHMLYTGQLSCLEARFADTVSRLKQSDPLREVWVIVPNQLTRLHLRRVLARALGVVANVRAMTITDLMHSLAEPLVLSEGWRTLGESVLDPLLAESVEGVHEKLEYLKPVSRSPGFRKALMRTRQELILHEVSPAGLHSVPLADRERAAKLRDLMTLISTIDKKLVAQKLHDSALLQEIALRALTEHTAQTAPLLLYALYDLPPLTRKILRQVISSQETHAFLPWLEGRDNYNFIKPLRIWYITHEFTEHPQKSPADQYMPIRVVSAPKDSSVATEIIRDILYSDNIAAGDAAVLLPKGSATLTAVLESRCRTSGLAPYIYQAKTLGQSAAGHGLSALAHLLDGRFTLEQVRNYLNSAPFTQAVSALSREWLQLAEESHIVEGQNEWIRRIGQTLERLDYKATRLAEREDEGDEQSLTTLRKRIEAGKMFLEFLSTLFETIENVRSAPNWQTAVSALWEYYRGEINMDEEFADLTLQLEQAGQLDSAGVKVTPSGVTDFILATLETPGTRIGSFSKSTPLLAPREQCIGVSFPHVFLPGFNEGTIPHLQRQDPLLLDSDRKDVNKTLNTALPLASDWQQRERFLLEMQLQSATRAISIYISRADAEGRPQLISPYVSELLALARQEVELSEDIEIILTILPHRTVPAHPLEGAESARAISHNEYGRLTLGQARKTKHSSLGYLVQNERFQKSQSMEVARFSLSKFTKSDGLLESSDLKKQLAHAFASDQPIDATALEEYWKCPFRFAVTRLLEAAAPEETDRLNPVTARERGSILHKILQRYHGERIGKPITSGNYALADLQRIAKQELMYYARRAPVGPRFAAEQLERGILTTLAEYHVDLISQGGAWRTRYVEENFGYREEPFPDAVEHNNSDGGFTRFKGRFDRWDSDDSGSQILITDYKSGAGPDKNTRAAERRVQLAIYHLLAKTVSPESSIQSRFLYIERDKNKDEVNGEHEALLAESVNLLADIREGIFVPEPAEDDSTVCRTCSVKLACGAQRHSQKRVTTETVAGLKATRDSHADESAGDYDE